MEIKRPLLLISNDDGYAAKGICELVEMVSAYAESDLSRTELSELDRHLDRVREIFQKICRDNGLLSSPEACFAFLQELPEKYRQTSLFD
jgi:hypothetical protein